MIIWQIWPSTHLFYLLYLCYLTDRKQYVFYGDTPAHTGLIAYGVPQGSILGPLVFLLYIDDLSNALNGDVLSCFADDTTIYISDVNIDTLYRNANLERKAPKDWLDANKLALNSQSMVKT